MKSSQGLTAYLSKVFFSFFSKYQTHHRQFAGYVLKFK